jgi:hypothetical protein
MIPASSISPDVFFICNVAAEAAGEAILFNVATVWSILNLGHGLA